MKNNLLERIISSIWLGVLGCFFIYGFKETSLNLSYKFLTIPAITLFVFYGIYGFFYGFKKLLFSADQPNIFLLRCVASVWVISFSAYLVIFVTALIYHESTSPNFFILGIINFFAFLAAWIWLYRLFLFPKIIYVKLFPSYKQRIISAIWFGIVGGMLGDIIKFDVIFTFLLASYLGFTYGYSILLLPSSFKGLIKSLVIGFIFSSYALFIVFLMFILSDIFSDLFVHSGKNLGHSLESGYVLMIEVFPMAYLFFISLPGILSSLMLYFISRPWAKNGEPAR